MSPLRSNFSTIHQTLHGYSRGHRLMAASRNLSPATERALRLRSDYSGSSYLEGFETYLTGYALPEECCIAFARTWYAKEMRRPGCVWTQTLLLPEFLIEEIDEFSNLLTCFQRPSIDTVRDYEQVVQWTISSSSSATSTFNEADLTDLLYSVYCQPDEPVFIPSVSSSSFEKLILSLWSQQWPALRKEFSFCTGLLELRGRERLYDVQVVPASDSKVLRQSADLGILLPPDSLGSRKTPNWLSSAATDLVGQSKKLRSFYRRFADGEDSTRHSFSKYARVFHSLDASSTNLLETVKILVENFPKQTDATDLKLAVLGGNSVREFMIEIDDTALLNALIAVDSLSLDQSLLGVPSRVQDAWQRNNDKGMSLLREVVSRPDNLLYGCIVESSSHCINDIQMDEVVEMDCNTALFMLQCNFRLSTNNSIWRCQQCTTDALSQECHTALASSSHFASEVIKAQIMAERCNQLEAMEGILGNKFVECFLGAGPEAIRHVDKSSLSALRRILKKHRSSVLRWLQERSGLVNECDVFAGQGLLVGHSKNASRIIKVQERLVPNHLMLSPETHSHAAAVVLAAAFDQGGIDGELACRNAFPIFYSAALADKIAREDWDPLRTRLPRVGPEWDRCRMLRGGLIEQCVRQSWSEQTVIQCTQDGAMLKEIFHGWGWDKREKRLLKRVAAEIQNNPSSATSEQVAAATQYLSSIWT